jgi:hypothetical protein
MFIQHYFLSSSLILTGRLCTVCYKDYIHLLYFISSSSVLLMYGAIKGRRWFMLPWIVCTFAFLLAYLAGMCLSLWLVGILVFSILGRMMKLPN